MPFDTAAAKAAGYSDAEIQQYLGEQGGQSRSFDTAAAKAAGYSDAEIQQYLHGQGAQAEQAADPTAGMGTAEKVLAGVGSGMTDVGLGLKQAIADIGLPKLLSFASMLPGGSTASVLSKALAQHEAEHGPVLDPAAVQAQVGEKRKLDAPLAATGAGATGQTIGKIAATLPAAMAAPVSGIGGAALLGAGLGAVEPIAAGESRMANAAGGAVGGAVGGAALGGLARLISPNASTNPAIQKLLQENVSLTPGRLLGPTASRFEDASTSTPFIGDIIKRAQDTGLKEFNVAALNRVLEPLGEKLSAAATAGRDTLEAVAGRVSKAYDDLLPRMKVQADAPFMQDLVNLRNATRNMPPARAQQFDQLLESHLLSRFTDAGLMNGASLKQAQSELGRAAKDYMSSSTADERILGTALKEMQNILRRAIERNNPAHAKELSAIDNAYAQLARVEDASLRSTGNLEPGVFTPQQLLNAAKKKDTSFGKRQFNVRGQAPMQDLAEAGSMLRSAEPNSGTPYRMMTEAALVGGLATMNPALLASIPITSGLYSSAGRNALTTLMARRPQEAQAIAEALMRGMPLAALAGEQQQRNVQ